MRKSNNCLEGIDSYNNSNFYQNHIDEYVAFKLISSLSFNQVVDNSNTLAKRADNEIKKYWNSHLKKRLTQMGLDPVTHKPKSYALGSASSRGESKDEANLSHMAQRESARLEAEAIIRRPRIQALIQQGPSSNNGFEENKNDWNNLLDCSSAYSLENV